MSRAGLAKRQAFDFYRTPQKPIEQLLKRLYIHEEAIAFEPCLGSQEIATLLPTNTLYYCELNEGVDYLSNNSLPSTDLLVTNPPYTYAQEFIDKSFTHTCGVIAYLLRLNFLGSQKRHIWWQRRLPTHLYVLSDRPSFKTNGGTDATEYAWFVWDLKNSSYAYCLDTPGLYVI